MQSKVSELGVANSKAKSLLTDLAASSDQIEKLQTEVVALREADQDVAQLRVELASVTARLHSEVERYRSG